MTLADLQELVDILVLKAEHAGHDPKELPVIGLNMHGEYRTDHVAVVLRLQPSDPDGHFNDSEWSPGPCVGVQSEY